MEWIAFTENEIEYLREMCKIVEEMQMTIDDRIVLNQIINKVKK